MKKLLSKRAKKLRKNNTDAESHLWFLLRDRRLSRYKFKRQYVIGRYIVDFVCLHKKLVIELDGGQHIEAKAYDDIRSRYITANGYKVLRFWNDEVLKETHAVLEVIFKTLESSVTVFPSPYPYPSPATSTENLLNT